MARETSIQSYQAIKAGNYLSKRRWEVYDTLFTNGPLTASEVFKIMAEEKGIKLGFMHNNHSRFSELRDMGIIRELGKRLCTVTGMTVIEWDVTPNLPKTLKRRVPNPERNKIVRETFRDIYWRVKNNIPIDLQWLEVEAKRVLEILETGYDPKESTDNNSEN